MSFWDMAMVRNGAQPLDLDFFSLLLHLFQGEVIDLATVRALLGFEEGAILAELDEFLSVLPANGVEYSLAVLKGSRLQFFELDTVAEVKNALGITP